MLSQRTSSEVRNFGSLRWLVAVGQVVLLLVGSPAIAQVDRSDYRLLRQGLRDLRHMQVAVSGRVEETIRIVGKAPWREEPHQQDPGLKGETVYRTWSRTSGRRTYLWTWHGDRYRIVGGLSGGDIREQTRCDGRLEYDLTQQAAGHGHAWGSIDRPRGTIPTPATFAYMPNCRWAEDVLAEMRLRTVRRIPGPEDHEQIECVGTDRGRYTRLVFDPSRRYAMVSYESDGDRAGSVERVTEWKQIDSFHVPVSMEQEMRSGPSRSAPVWRILRLQLSDINVGPVQEQEFQPKWPEGTEIVNVPEGKLYRCTNGRMEFLMHVGGRTPARMLMGWSIIGAITVAGALPVQALTRRRRSPKQAAP